MGTPVIAKMGSLALRIDPPRDSCIGSCAVTFKVRNLNKDSVRVTSMHVNGEVRRVYSRSDFYVRPGRSRSLTFYTYGMDKSCRILGEYARITIVRDKSGRLSHTCTMGNLVDLVARGEIDCSHMW